MSVHLFRGENGWDVVQLRHRNGSTCTVQQLGACITSWCDAARGEQLFISELSPWEPGKAIVGGITVCFPQLTFEQEMAYHPQGVREADGWAVPARETLQGFASSCLWTIDAEGIEDSRSMPPSVALGLQDDGADKYAEASDADPRVILRLRDSPELRAQHSFEHINLNRAPELRAAWPHYFELELTVTLRADALDTRLEVINGATRRPVYTPIDGHHPQALAAAIRQADGSFDGGGEGEGGGASFMSSKGTRDFVSGLVRPHELGLEEGGSAFRFQAALFCWLAIPPPAPSPHSSRQSSRQSTRRQRPQTPRYSHDRNGSGGGGSRIPGPPLGGADGDEPTSEELERIRATPAAELTIEELQLDARARVRRRQRANAIAEKARERASAQALAATQAALRGSVMGAAVDGLQGLPVADLLQGQMREPEGSDGVVSLQYQRPPAAAGLGAGASQVPAWAAAVQLTPDGMAQVGHSLPVASTLALH